jgi:hypothetical protein
MGTRRGPLAGAATVTVAIAGCLQVSYVGPTGGGRFPADLPVPESALVRGTPRDAIPAITDPAFAADWSGVSLEAPTVDFGVRRIEPRLAPFDRVVGVEREAVASTERGKSPTDPDGRARAYPLRVLG